MEETASLNAPPESLHLWRAKTGHSSGQPEKGRVNLWKSYITPDYLCVDPLSLMVTSPSLRIVSFGRLLTIFGREFIF